MSPCSRPWCSARARARRAPRRDREALRHPSAHARRARVRGEREGLDDLNVVSAGPDFGPPGIVATCRAVGVPVQAYLAWAFERLGTHRDVFALPLDEITPAAFKRAGPGR